MFVKSQEIFNLPGVVPAFNISTFEAAKAITLAAAEANQPVIIQTSENETRFMGAGHVYSIVKSLAEAVTVPVSLHLDHGKDMKVINECLAVGYSSVMADGETDFIREVALLAHRNGAIVEGNTDDYQKISEFISQTGVDIVAPEKNNYVSLETIKQVHQQTNLPIALHGESTQTLEMIKESLKFGVKKVNFNTPLRQAYTETLRKVLSENPEEIVPYKFLDRVIEAVKMVVREKIELIKLN
jgi:fructose/tagatose bisphosphate aldolase